jgi:pimeloyl-ACP methyl ester carboxylesterase
MSAHPIEVKAIILQHTTYINPVRTSVWSGLLTKIRRPVLTPLCYLLIILSPFFRVMRWLSYLNGMHHMLNRFLMFTGRQSWRQLNMVSFLSAKTPPSVFARGMLAMFRWGVEEWLYRIKVPALVIAGSKDKLTKPDASSYICRQVANAQLHIVDAGHMGQIERHEDVNIATQQFIKNLQA